MRRTGSILLFPLLGGLALATSPMFAQSEEAARIKAATTVLQEIKDAPDGGVPSWVVEKAQGVAVFPGVKKGGLLIGGEGGRGIISAKSMKSGTWSAPAFLTLTGASIGAQIGGQEVDLLLVVIDQKGLEQLASNQFKL